MKAGAGLLKSHLNEGSNELVQDHVSMELAQYHASRELAQDHASTRKMVSSC